MWGKFFCHFKKQLLKCATYSTMQQQQSSRSKPSGVRGISWKERETRDLLEIWGDARMQEALRSSHRNWDSFERIAREMASRGHRRTPEECRTKTKTLRMEYRRVVAHNNQSSSKRLTCPFFSELHRILRGDASMKPRQLVKNLEFTEPTGPTHAPVAVNAGLEEFFTHDLTVIKTEDIEGPSQESRVLPAPDKNEEDEDFNAIQTENLGDEQAEGETTEEDNFEEDRGLQIPTSAAVQDHGSDEDVPPSAASRLARSRGRKRRATALHCVAERMMAHSSRQLEVELEERRKDREMEMALRNREMEMWKMEQESRERVMMQVLREASQERELIHQALQRNFHILETTAETLKQFVARVQSMPHPGGRTTHAPSNANLNSEVHGRGGSKDGH